MIVFSTGYVSKVFPERGYGFIVSATGASVFFHMRNAGTVMVVPVDAGYEIRPCAGPCSIPKVRDKLVFVCCEKQQGFKAAPWAHVADYEAAAAEIAAMPCYRLIETRLFIGKIVEAKVISRREVWIGTNIANLCDKHIDISTRHEGAIKVSFSFEQQVDGKWVPCGDPRNSRESNAA